MVKEIKLYKGLRITSSDSDEIYLHFCAAQGEKSGVCLDKSEIWKKTALAWAKTVFHERSRVPSQEQCLICLEPTGKTGKETARYEILLKLFTIDSLDHIPPGCAIGPLCLDCIKALKRLGYIEEETDAGENNTLS